MSTYTWGDWRKTATEASGGPTIPEGQYTGEVIDAGSKPAKNGKPRLWWKFKILVGPEAGKTEIMSQMLNPENPKALAAFYGVLNRLGVNWDNIPDGTPPEAIARSLIGNRYSFDFSHRPVDDKVFGDFKNVSLIDNAVATPPPAVVVPPAAVPAIEAVAQAPVTEAALAPAQQTVEELQAQLAALQAAQAPAAPAAGVTVVPPAPGGALPF